MRINWHPYKISSHGCQTNKQHAMSTHRGIIARQNIVIVTEETEFIHANLSTIGSCIRIAAIWYQPAMRVSSDE